MAKSKGQALLERVSKISKVSDAKEKEIIVINFGPNTAVFERETEHESKEEYFERVNEWLMLLNHLLSHLLCLQAC